MAIIHVVGAAIVEGDKVLAAQRGAGRPFAGMWEFAGGKVEPGETPEAALAREIHEELGLTIEVGPWLGVGTALHGERTIQLDVYAARRIGGELVVHEHAEARWVSAAELATLTWAEADVPIVPAVARWLEQRVALASAPVGPG